MLKAGGRGSTRGKRRDVQAGTTVRTQRKHANIDKARADPRTRTLAGVRRDAWGSESGRKSTILRLGVLHHVKKK